VGGGWVGGKGSGADDFDEIRHTHAITVVIHRIYPKLTRNISNITMEK